MIQVRIAKLRLLTKKPQMKTMSFMSISINSRGYRYGFLSHEDDGLKYNIHVIDSC